MNEERADEKGNGILVRERKSQDFYKYYKIPRRENDTMAFYHTLEYFKAYYFLCLCHISPMKFREVCAEREKERL